MFIKEKLRDAALFLSILLLFPCVVAMLSGKNSQVDAKSIIEKDGKVSNYYVKYEDELFTQYLPLEEYLIGEIAAVMSIDSEMEALKAQVILLRTNYFAKLSKEQAVEKAPIEGTVSGQEGVTGVNISNGDIIVDMDNSGYFSVSQMQKFWGDSFEENYKKCKSAVNETNGIVILYKNETVEIPYHLMSSGKTRNAATIFSDGRYKYLNEINCEKNIENSNFLQKTMFPEEEFESLEVKERDTCGYVLSISCNGAEMSGEEFRSKYKLPSANLNIVKNDTNYIIETKGIGHGLGFDQTYAEYLAKQGNDYIDILKYFFENFAISKF